MKGLELARRYWQEYGEPMLREQFPQLYGQVAAGLAGSGSECFGYDDPTSQDHDFEPCFCLFLPEEAEVSRTEEFRLERAYARLPSEFMGYRRERLSPVGERRHGVIRMGDFFLSKVGQRDGALSVGEWLTVPEYSLLEAVNGEVFHDPAGRFSAIRQGLSQMPEDVRLKRLAGRLFLMGQSGQYNYGRCLERGETGAAQLAVYEFAKSAMAAAFLLERRYMPYYKWSFRALSELSFSEEFPRSLERIISTENSGEAARVKAADMESVTAAVLGAAAEQGLCEEGLLVAAAYQVNDRIKDGNVRNLHILYTV